MLKNIITTAFRTFQKNIGFVLINIFGLAIAIACCVTAYINYDYGTSFDQEIENRDRIFRVNMLREFQGETYRYGTSPLPLADNLKETDNSIEYMSRYYSKSFNLKSEKDIFAPVTAFVDPDFFKIFSFKIEYGAKDIEDRSKIFISDQLAQRLFGTIDCIGKQLSMQPGSRTIDYVVGGVFKKFSLNNSFQFDALTNILNFEYIDGPINRSWSSRISLFLELDDKSKKQEVEASLQRFIPMQNKADADVVAKSFYLDPFEGMALRASSTDLLEHEFRSPQPMAANLVPWIMAILILLIATFNYVNTFIAISSKRLKEISLRKVMGGVRHQLVFQFLTESVLICIAGLLLGLVLAEALVPAYSSLWPFLDLKISYFSEPGLFIVLAILLIGIGIGAGLYPALYISKFNPIQIMRGSLKFQGRNPLARILLLTQFSFCIISLILAFSFIRNANYQDSLDLGFDPSYRITHNLASGSEYQLFKTELEKETVFEAVTGTKDHLFSSWEKYPVRHNELNFESEILMVSHDYLEFMDIEVIQGRGFKENSMSDVKESVVVNESFVRNMSWEDPIGKMLIYQDSVQLFVIGVVKDIYTTAFWEKPGPLMFRNIDQDNYKKIIATYSPENHDLAQEKFKEVFYSVFPGKLFASRMSDFRIENARMINTNVTGMFLFLGLTALILTSIGLYSYVSLKVVKKTKEIGVRKVMGASSSQIMYRLSRGFLIIIILGAVIAVPVAYFGSNALMGIIWTYYQPADFSGSLVALLLVFLVAVSTFGFKIWEAANINPANSLRSE